MAIEKAEVGLSGEVGSTGLNRFGGLVYEEFLVELQRDRGRKVYDEMRRNDAIVGAILFAIEMALREVNWFTLPEGSREAEFLAEAMHDMSHTWPDFISEILLMLPFGYSYFEVVYKKRLDKQSKFNDGGIGWRKFGYRSPDTLYKWVIDKEGGIRGFVQMALPDLRQIFIPIEKSVLFRTKREKNNPEGISILRNAYRAWYFKKNLESLEGISLERVYAGFPVIYLPHGATSDASRAKAIVRGVRIDEQMGLVLPDGWRFVLEGPQNSRGLDAFNVSISRYRQEIMMSVMATFIALGIEKAGSYALAREERDFFQIALQGWLNNIRDTLNEFTVPKLLALNGFDKNSAKLSTGKVGQIDLEKLGNYIKNLTDSFALTPDPQLETYLRESAGLPPRMKGAKPIKPEEKPEPEMEEEEEKAISKDEFGEDWHPQIKKRPVTLREMRKAEGELERSVRRFFPEAENMDNEQLAKFITKKEI